MGQNWKERCVRDDTGEVPWHPTQQLLRLWLLLALSLRSISWTLTLSHPEIYMNVCTYLYMYTHTHTHTHIYDQSGLEFLRKEPQELKNSAFLNPLQEAGNPSSYGNLRSFWKALKGKRSVISLVLIRNPRNWENQTLYELDENGVEKRDILLRVLPDLRYPRF